MALQKTHWGLRGACSALHGIAGNTLGLAWDLPGTYKNKAWSRIVLAPVAPCLPACGFSAPLGTVWNCLKLAWNSLGTA